MLPPGYTHSLSFQSFHRPNPATPLVVHSKVLYHHIIHPFSTQYPEITHSFQFFPLSLFGIICIATRSLLYRYTTSLFWKSRWFTHSARLPPSAFNIIVIFCIHIIRLQHHAYNRFYPIVFGLLVRSRRWLVGGVVSCFGRVLLLVHCSV